MRVVIVGAGGHARSVIEALRTGSDELEPVACTDPDPARIGTAVDGVPVIGDDQQLAALRSEGVDGACLGLGGVGDNEPRRRLFEHVRSLGFTLPPVLHGTSEVAASARLGPGTQVLAGAIVGAGVRAGANVIVNTGAILDHDCRIGDHVHVATGCALGGGVDVGTGAHVGIGACVLQAVAVGDRAVVGAGAVVIRDVPAGVVVVGCPAVALVRSS
jgi:UDP-perosamine 4-acetyltransferase